MDLSAVKQAYRRHAHYYDLVFGLFLQRGRMLAIEKVNGLAETEVLEVGVGTGISLPHFARHKRIVGVDVSPEMLERARRRVREERLSHVQALLEMDAEQLAFADDSFEIVVAMYVASVVPNPPRLMSELQRVCVPNGHILVVNHSTRNGGLRGSAERRLAPLASMLGWRPDFALEPFLRAGTVDVVEWRDIKPFGLFTLVHCRNAK
jgi:phosphatidylethanolamine/phosphatidyl-N-methylethanolamine N-methyltransferase